VQPAPVSGAAALGAACFAWHHLLERPRRQGLPDGQRGSCLGPGYSSEEVATALDAEQVVYRRIDDEGSLVEGVARFLAEQKVVAWVQGRLPFASSALASRSVFVDARSEFLRTFVNERIEPAPATRPLIPTVTIEHARDCFELPAGHESPYALLTAQVIAPASDGADGRADPILPAIEQVDGTAQVQTVDATRHPRTHRLLEAFARRTGCSVLASAALRPAGEALACSPADAVRAFKALPIDLLVVEDFVVLRRDQPWAGEDGARRGLSGWFAGAHSTG
jgi:carbamoyltransferase